MSPISTEEIESVNLKWVRYVQGQEFTLELEALKNGKPCPAKSRIFTLNPFLDSEQLIRVGGRLRNSDLMFEQKHPLLLPQHHHLTKLIVQHFHERLLHAGPQLMLHTIQQKYWIPRGKDVARARVRKCITCFRQNAEVQQQMMGDLPKSRVVPSPAFFKSGVDYAGPFLLKAMKGRTPKTFKGYIAVAQEIRWPTIDASGNL
ncbi:unnamed protein product [Allacma fusca]|uniref:Integrase zinc-binding domain-containing protein n=1 Tax=Allacma fusca TaxID=39272 RepID=A0A8J2KR80_9HEXA|nr:unnamed protein product [Allacma fusca]